MTTRREARVKAFLPVRVSGTDLNGNPFIQTAHVIDVSRVGARLSGIRCLRGAGEIVTVQCSGKIAKFSVVWIGQPGSAQDGHFGVRALNPEKRIFKVAIPETTTTCYAPMIQQLPLNPDPKPVLVRAPLPWDQKTERRKFPRVRCSGTGQILQEGVSFPIWAKICYLSLSGCYLELVFTIAPGTTIDLKMTVSGRTFSAKGVVASSHPGIGIGVSFSKLDPASKATLTEIVQDLRAMRRRGQASD